MKFTAIFSAAFLAAGVVAQEAYGVNDFATRDVASADELVLRALHHVRRQADDHAALIARAVDLLDMALDARSETWGTGKYTFDLHKYHDDIKPKLISKFTAQYSDFKSKCGTNPDFEVDRKGNVSPSSRSKAAVCNKKRFDMDLGSWLAGFHTPPPSRSPSPTGHRKRSLFSLDELEY